MIADIVLLVLTIAAWTGCYGQRPIQVLRRHLRPEIATGKAALVSAMPQDQRLNVSIVLPLRNQTELASLLKRLYDPSSPDYRHFLSVEQFTDRFGPTAADYEAVVSFARANGFTITGTRANRLVVPISGTVAQINEAFNLTMNVYQHPTEDRTFFSPDREPSLSLSVPVAHIAGLNNYSLPRPMLVQVPQSQQIANVTGSGPGGNYLASDMRQAYYGGTTLDGNGQAVGILEFDGYYLSDVNLNFSSVSQTNNVPIINVLLDGATGNPVYGNDAEQVLDIVQAIGMAPGLSQARVYIGLNDVDILSSMASENIAKQLSCSWSWLPDDPAVADVFFDEFAAQGQSFFTASGDAGAFDSNINPYFYPQEDAYVTSVGATHLETNGAGGGWVSETAWNSPPYGSGGGISPDGIGIPNYQTGVANSSNGGSTTLRNVPDVAMEGDFDNYLCEMGTCSLGWAGTSFSAPRWAAFMALINQQAVEAGTAANGGLGFLNPSLYAIGQGSSYGNDLHDVASGNNDTNNQPTWFSAVAGYDLVTGWGSANGQNLIDDLAGPQVPGFWISGSPSTVSINQGGSASTTLTITDADGFAGNVTLAITAPLPSGVTASWGTNPTSGSSVLTLSASGSAPVSTTALTITGTSGNLSATTNVNVAVHAPTFALSASPSGLTLNQGGTGTTTITVTPEYGFSGKVNLSVAGLPTGVTATWGTNPTSGTSVLTLTASSSAPGGASQLTITGVSGNLTITTSLTLTIQAPTFTLSSGGNVDMGIGATGYAYLYVYPQYGFSGNVNLSVSGLPNGVTASFSPNPTTGFSQLMLTSTSAASEGSSTLTVTGTSGNITATTTVMLTIHRPSFTLSDSGNLDIGQGNSGTAYVYVSSQYGFTGSVTLSISGLPSGVTALWNPNPTSGSSNLTLTATNSAPVGQYTLTITGTSGSLTASTTLTLNIHVPTFTLSSSGSVNIGQGTSTTTYVSVSPQYGFTGSVNLSVTGLPAGVTASFSPNPTTGSSTLTLTASSTTAVGQYNLTITGTYQSQIKTATLTLAVFVPTFTLYGGGYVNIGQGTSGNTYVYVNPQYGFNGSVNLSVSGLPSGVTASFSPNPTTSSSMLTFTASSTASTGQYTVTITGSSGAQTATTTVSLGVYVPSFTLYGPGSVSIGQGTSSTSYVSVNPMYGFSGNVNLSVSGLPSGVTASFSPNPTTGHSTLTLTASSTGSLGQYTVTITGTSGTQTASVNFTLGVYVPSFTLSGPGAVSIGQGSSTTSYVWVFPQYGFNSNVNLSVSGLPSGVTSSLSPNPTTGSSTLTLTASSTAAIGQYTVTITGTSGSQTASTTFSLGVYAQSFSIYAYPNSFSMNEGTSSTVTVSVTPNYGFNGNVSFSASNLPTGVTASFSPNPSTNSSVMSLTASRSAIPGTATITITGSSGTITASTTISLTINTPNFTILDAPSAVTIAPGGSEISTILIFPQFGFSGEVNFALTGLPAGVSASFSPNPATNSTALTLSADSSAAPGNSAISISGISGSLVATTPLALTIANPPSGTSTTLALTAAGSSASTVAAGTVVRLTSAVSSGPTPVKAGQVNFCDATATYCDEFHRLGSAQLTSDGTASMNFIPGMGGHSYKAVFAGTKVEAASSSTPSALTVTASQPSTATIKQSGTAGNYTLTATVAGQGLISPTGIVSFVDVTNGSAAIGSVDLAPIGTTLNFVNSQTLATGTYATAAVAGDINGDGISDIAVVNSNANNLAIFLGKGDGTFNATSSNPSTGPSPSSVAIGDFNGDGKADIAVSNLNGNSVTVLLGNGDGTFTASTQSSQTGNGPVSLAVADFNRDGIQDLAVANASSNTVTVLLGNGDGTFTANAQSPQTGNNPRSIVAGDFNGDGIPDLAVANSWDNTVTILLGNGDGTFVPIAKVSTGSYPISLAVGDFNADGKPDLAVANAYDASITILLGHGDGTFGGSAPAVSIGTQPTFVAIGDFNADGNSDLAVASQFGDSVSILLGHGDGTFDAGTPLAGSGPVSVAIQDFNGDGIPDLAMLNNFAGTISILNSQLTQTATASATGISPIGIGSHDVAASYPGDSNYKASISANTSITGQTVTPTVAVTPSNSAITTIAPLDVTVLVSGPSGSPTPTGSVKLSGGGYTSSATTLIVGSATISVPAGSLAIGTDTLTAGYTPDSTGSAAFQAASGSSTVTVAEGKITPTVTVTPATGSIGSSQDLSVAISVSGGSGKPVATGSITLSGGGYTSAATELSNGSATVSIPAGSLAVGADTLAATYSGDALYFGASGTSSVTVVASVFSLSATSPAAVSRGASAASTVTVNSTTGYSGTVVLRCTLNSGGPANATADTPTCSAPAGGIGMGDTATVTVTTKAGTSSALAKPLIPGRGRGLFGGGTVLALLVFLGIPLRRRSWQLMLSSLALLGVLSIMTACGGGNGSSSGGGGSKTDPGTASGTYTFSVTGTGTPAISSAPTATFTVTVN